MRHKYIYVNIITNIKNLKKNVPAYPLHIYLYMYM